MKFSLPANLLLMGEYAILEEGGKGIVLATEPRSYVTLTPSNHWEMIGLWGTVCEVVDPFRDKEAFTSFVFNYLRDRYLDLSRMSPYSITIDTRAFFDEHGRKKGYGSSAVVAAGITVALFSLAQGRGDLASTCFQPAVEAHRVTQNGKGSGYDIATSLYGGTGIFTGGVKPHWRAVDHLSPQGFFLFQGEKPVRTLSAIEEYRKWRYSAAGTDWLAQINALVDTFEKEANEDQLRKVLRQAAVLGRDLSRRIGVSAELSPSDSEWQQEALVKALGAGNETFLFVDPPTADVFLPIVMAKEGLRWEE